MQMDIIGVGARGLLYADTLAAVDEPLHEMIRDMISDMPLIQGENG